MSGRVAIVGAGPAGTSLAIRLARRGVGVDLVEKAAFPRSKPCGEGLMPKSLEHLAELGVLGAAESAGQHFEGIAYVSGETRAEARFPGIPGRLCHGLGVPREVLDLRLLEAALATPGVSFHPETRVHDLVLTGGRASALRTDQGDLPCDAVVGADGRNSVVRRRAGLDGAAPCRPRGALVGALEVDGPLPEVVEVHLTPGAEVYLTPTAPGRVQVAVCLEAAALREVAGDTSRGFLRALESSPGTARLLERSRLRGQVRGVGCLSAGARVAASRGVFLAGDAAGFLDPVTGEGTSLALSDTRSLAPLLAEALRTGDLATAEREYARRLRSGERLQVAALTHGILTVLRAPALARFLIRRLARRPRLLERLVAVAAGLGNFHEVRPSEILAVLLP